jgi:hypothetical protein
MENDNIFADELALKLGYRAVKLDTPEVLDWFEPTLGKSVHIENWYYIADRNGKPVSKNWQTEDLAWEHFHVEGWELELELVRDDLKSLMRSGDQEAAHIKADALLIHALEMAAETLDDDDKTLISEIISAYQSIDKWYA